MRRAMIMMSAMGMGAGAAVADVPRVAVDIAPVHSIVAAVMGDLGQPDLIVPPGASPHGYSLRPSEARALDQADLVVWVGHGLTPWLEGPVDALGAGADKIELMELEVTRLLDIREGVAFAAHDHDHGDGHEAHEAKADAGHDDHGHDDHGHGEEAKAKDEHGHDDHGHDDHGHEDHAEEAGHDDHGHEDHVGHDDHAHGSVDPHVWLDPANAAAWATAIAAKLSEKDPENASTYFTNATAFASDMSALEGDIEAIIAPVRGQSFVVFHDAYHYFEHRFDIEAAGSVSAGDAVAPSAGRMSALQETIEARGATCALTEPQFNPDIINALGDITLAEIDPLGAKLTPGPELYGDLMRNLATGLASCWTKS